VTQKRQQNEEPATKADVLSRSTAETVKAPSVKTKKTKRRASTGKSAPTGRQKHTCNEPPQPTGAVRTIVRTEGNAVAGNCCSRCYNWAHFASCLTDLQKKATDLRRQRLAADVSLQNRFSGLERAPRVRKPTSSSAALYKMSGSTSHGTKAPSLSTAFQFDTKADLRSQNLRANVCGPAWGYDSKRYRGALAVPPPDG
jgi:hypothetical protein